MSTSTISGTAVSTPVTTPATLDRLVNIYAWLDETKSVLDISVTTYDYVLLTMLENASRMIDAITGWVYFPSLATRYFDVTKSNKRADDETFYLPDPMLAAIAIYMSDDDGSTYDVTFSATDYYLTYGGDYNQTPYTEIVLSENGSYDYWYTGQRSVKITGTWGFRRDYAAAWENSQDTCALAMNASQTTITVADANGADQRGIIPRFQTGQLVRADSEYMVVTGTNTTTNVLTVIRGANGTTAATHALSTRLDIWRPEPLVQQATRIQAVRWFKRGQQAYQDVAAAIELGQLTYAQELDPDIRSMVKSGLVRLV